MPSCAAAKAAQGKKPQDGNYLLTSPPAAVYCVMGGKKDAPTTYLLLPATGAANPVWPYI